MYVAASFVITFPVIMVDMSEVYYHMDKDSHF